MARASGGYRRAMAGEPSNAALRLVRRWFAELFNDPVAWADGRVRSVLARDFVRIDRRRLVSLPLSDADAFIDTTLELARVAGAFPVYTMYEIVGLRGERLIALRLNAVLNADEIDLIQVVRLDAKCEKLELVVQLEAEQLDEALAEPDRLHAGLGGY